MCNLLITNLKNEDKINEANKFQKFRGPDNEKKIIFDNITFLHNLLSITGQFITQPFENNNVIICFNGEIYNFYTFGNFKSEVECIAYLYSQGIDSLKKLDGEFAIVIYDKNKKIFYLINDIFAMKPLFIGINKDKFCISSYKSACSILGFKNIRKISPNSIFLFDIKMDKKLNKISELYKWDLNQHKNNLKDFFISLETAILKRVATNKTILVNLSSGYDSGVICCVLNKHNIPYNTASIIGKEDVDILMQRKKINKTKKFSLIFDISNNEKKELRNYICKNTENYHVDRFFFKNGKMKKGDYNFKIDNASVGAAKIYNEVRNKFNVKVILSGTGADEILSDYGWNGKRILPHSCFGGKFPEKLETIFPKNSDDKKCIWKNFYYSCQESYLWKEEVISGLYGIEGRYPFLDKEFVQEFLWLTPELKNDEYKGVLRKYLEYNKYPYTLKKVGFNV